MASSWRNTHQPEVIRVLREAGHEVYARPGSKWADIDPEWQLWTPERYREFLADPAREFLAHPAIEAGFTSDMDALRWCDAVVGVQPFGRSASLELGWAVGAGKLTVLLLSEGEPELMVKMCDHICVGTGEMLAALENREVIQ